MAPLNILISGAGVAGPTLAFWLNHLGHKVTVVEFFPTLRTGGQQVDCRAQGIRVIRQMGLEQTIKDACVNEDGTAILYPSGKPAAVFMANKSGTGRQSFTTEFEIMCGDLCRVLYDATKDRTTYMFGVSVESFDQSSSSVTVHFSDSTSASYDLLVGADGHNSRTRRQLLGPADAADSVKSLGLFAAYFTVPRTPQLEAHKLMKILQLPNHRAAFTRCDKCPDHMQTYLFTMPPTHAVRTHLRNLIKSGDLAAQKAALAEHFADVEAVWELPRILAGTETTPDFHMTEIGQVKTPIWSKGRVVLLGDAAHGTAPDGWGTTSAFVGAYVLAGELSRSANDIGEALSRYDSTLRPFVREVHKISPWALRLFMPGSRLGIWVLRTIARIVVGLGIDRLMLARLPEERGGWVFPEYPALLNRESAPVA
ncbi:oxidoreductase [Mycena sp. CBHHK59/15]|nr:oxidoreductase [Mycena sp. CBHHK59/15]